MGRDYKSIRRTTTAKKKRRPSRRKTTTRRRRQTRTPGWLWMLSGLSIGLGIAIGSYFYGQQKAPIQTTPAVTESVVKKSSTRTQPQKEQAAPEQATTEQKSQFDFYTILPKMEVVIPNSMIEEANRALPQHDKDLAFLLQTGSFRAAADAETMKAKLALLDIQAHIETVVINDQETWHRVRLGPFPNMAALKADRRNLKSHNIDFILLKVKL